MLKKDVIAYFGSVRKTAEFLGVSTQRVYQWPEVVPEGMAYKLHVMTDCGLDIKKEDYIPVE